MAIMRAVFRERYPRFDDLLRERLPRFAADPVRLRTFCHWSNLDQAAARNALTTFNSDPWIDVGDAGSPRSGGAVARGSFDPRFENRVTIADDMVALLQARPDDPDLQLLLESTVLHELVHWGYCKAGGREHANEERGRDFELEAYRRTHSRDDVKHAAVQDGRFVLPVQGVEATRVRPLPLGPPPAAAPGDLRDGTIRALINIFETGAVRGDYARVTLAVGDSGGLTYGRSQTTLNSGGLSGLVERYVAMPGNRWGDALEAYRMALAERDSALERDIFFQNLLRAAADDPLMRDAQDAFFAADYWQPTCDTAARLGIRTALGLAVVYDSFVHGSWGLIRRRTDAIHGRLADLGEERWIEAYVATRRQWLANNRKRLLRATVYRMDAFAGLIASRAWNLDLPLVVRGCEINTRTLVAAPTGVYDRPALGERDIALTDPLQRGLDVRMVQLALSAAPHGRPITADGIFGRRSAQAVQEVQLQLGLVPSGAFGSQEYQAFAATWNALGISSVLARQACPDEVPIIDLISAGRLQFDHPRLEMELLGRCGGAGVSPRLQALVVALCSRIEGTLRISSVLRDGGASHHGAGRAIDIGNEDIAAELLPWLGRADTVTALGIDELIFDAGVLGEADRNRWNYDQGVRHAYSVRTLDAHRDHIHVSVVAV